MAEESSSNRSLSGCLTCRGRRKKCDGPSQGSRSICGECIRLNIQCLGFRAERFEWMKDQGTLKAFTEEIKNWTSNRNNFLGGAPLSFDHFFELTNEQEYIPRSDIRHQSRSPPGIPAHGWPPNQPSSSGETQIYYEPHPYHPSPHPSDTAAQGSQWVEGPLVNYPPLPPIGEMLPGTAPQSGNFPYQSYSDIQGSVHVHGPASTFPPGYPSGLQPPLPYEFPHPHTPVALPSAQQYVGPTQSSAEPQQVVEQRYNPQLQYTQPSQYPPPGPYILPESQSDEPTDDDGHETPTHQ